MTDYYKILGVSRNASQEEIRKAYLKQVKRYHPDTNPKNKKLEERMKLINEAYKILSDPISRSKYDFNYYFDDSSKSTKNSSYESEDAHYNSSKSTANDFINNLADTIKELKEKLHKLGLDSVFKDIMKILEDDSNPEKAEAIKKTIVEFTKSSLIVGIVNLIQSFTKDQKKDQS